MEEEEKLLESQLQMLRERAIINEEPEERVVESVQTKLEKSKKKKQ